jgi:hypothetical protein
MRFATKDDRRHMVAQRFNPNYCTSNDFGLVSRKTTEATQDVLTSPEQTAVAQNAIRDKSPSATD